MSTHRPAVVAPVQLANWVVLPVLVPTASAFDPPPITGRLAVNAEAFVLQVEHVKVRSVDRAPPPARGEVVDTDLVTVVATMAPVPIAAREPVLSIWTPFAVPLAVNVTGFAAEVPTVWT